MFFVSLVFFLLPVTCFNLGGRHFEVQSASLSLGNFGLLKELLVHVLCVTLQKASAEAIAL